MYHQEGTTGFSGTSNLTMEAPKKAGAFEALDYELERLEKVIAALEQRLGPVSSQYAQVAGSEPHPEPASQIRGRVERLANLTSQIEQAIDRLDL